MKLFFVVAFCLISVGSQSLPAQSTAEVEESNYNYPQGRITVPSWRFAHGPHVRAAFREVVSEFRSAVVEVRVDGARTAYGGIVGPEGWVLTKASALGDTITCRLADGRELAARVVGTNREYDVAMLKVDVAQLPFLSIDESTTPIVGSWLASVGIDNYPVAVGIVSVEPREIPHQAGILGIQLAADGNRAQVVRVFPGSAAAKAGLLVNDVLLRINDQATPHREALIATIRQFSPGDRVTLVVERGSEQLEFEALLMGRFPGLQPSRMEIQNQLGSGLSERRFGFPSAFQHDTVIEPNDCGGPVVNLAGKVVGFNIARSGRTETYAVAASSLAKLIPELKQAP